MKAKWNNNDIKSFFSFVEQGLQNNLPLLNIFKNYATSVNKNPLTLRNFYYKQVKIFNNNKNLATELDINLNIHKVQNFSHFNLTQQAELKNKVDELVKKGYSVRRACNILSGGNIAQMLRLQNKYNSLCKKQCKVIPFPAKNTTKKTVLTDAEIKALFRGLVKLAKQNSPENSHLGVQTFLEQTEMQKRKEIVLLKQKQLEIDILKQEIISLRQKNINLNNSLINYRIELIKLQNIIKPN